MAQLKSGSTVGGSGIVTKNDNQALHDTDALRLSGTTLYIYKGNGTSESVALPSSVPTLYAEDGISMFDGSLDMIRVPVSTNWTTVAASRVPSCGAGSRMRVRFKSRWTSYDCDKHSCNISRVYMRLLVNGGQVGYLDSGSYGGPVYYVNDFNVTAGQSIEVQVRVQYSRAGRGLDGLPVSCVVLYGEG
jgi:hypothetical protein